MGEHVEARELHSADKVGANQYDTRGRVVLVSMPFCSLTSPSLALGLFQASLTERQFTCKTRYFSVEFARILGTELYKKISDGFPQTTDFLGEWIFSRSTHPYDPESEQRYMSLIENRLKIHKSLIPGSIDEILNAIRFARASVPKFLADCAADIIASQPHLVGITSTFQQHHASIGLSLELKRQSPRIVIVLGGANCEGEMGWQTAKSFLSIDAVVSGEGDNAFPKVVESVCNGEGIPRLDGVISREVVDGPVPSPIGLHTAVVENLDSLAEPVFDDYFSYISASDTVSLAEVRVPIETSRGCWWGEKNHCTFCGLNGHSMRFRGKSASVAIRSFMSGASRYPGARFSAVDNILDYRYFDEVMPSLIDARENGLELDIFYEVKANIKFEKMSLLARAGILNLQPGIESLSSSVLTLMKKGIKAIHNIQFLKNCRELGITPHWNLIFGFPQEDPIEYESMATLVPLIHHLFPPGGFSQIRLDRFSPNYNHATDFGLTHVRPFDAFSYLYDLDKDAVARLSYFFQYDYADGRDPSVYTMALSRAVDKWRGSYLSSDLLCVPQSEGALVFDFRDENTLAYILDDVHLSLLKRYHQAQPAGTQTRGDDLKLDCLLDHRLILELDGYYLSLVLPLGPVQPNPLALKKMSSMIDEGSLEAIRLV